MKNITFKKVTAENFLSTGKEVSLDFDKGISVIVGVNMIRVVTPTGVESLP